MSTEVDGALDDPVVTDRTQAVVPAVTTVLEIAQFPSPRLFRIEFVAALR